MKHFWIGLGILGTLLAGSVLGLRLLDRQTQAVAARLEQAAGAREPEEMVRAAEEARIAWRRYYGLMAMVTDHAGMDEIAAGFAELEQLEQDRDPGEIGRQCRALALRVRMLYGTERLTYYNFL